MESVVVTAETVVAMSTTETSEAALRVINDLLSVRRSQNLRSASGVGRLGFPWPAGGVRPLLLSPPSHYLPIALEKAEMLQHLSDKVGQQGAGRSVLSVGSSEKQRDELIRCCCPPKPIDTTPACGE